MNKQGVSLIILVITIIVLGLLVSIVSINVADATKESNARNFASEVKQLEHLVKEYRTLQDGNLDFVPYTLLVSTLNSDLIGQLDKETQKDGNIVLYKLDFVKLDVMDTLYGQRQNGDNDIYLVSKETGKVYYLQGYKWNGKTHYTLTEELNGLFKGSTIN